MKKPTLHHILLLLILALPFYTKAQTNVHRQDSTARSGFLSPGQRIPSEIWYGQQLLSHRVRLLAWPLDSFPDQINLRVVKKAEDFCFPVKGIITSPYGWRWERGHRGVDILLTTGTPVRCAFSGVVRVAAPMGGYGNCIVVRHYNGLETVYGHLSKINVRPLQVVNAGDTIGLGGSTGHSTGPHLHFEVRFQYETIDPEWLLDFKTYSLRTRTLHLDKTYFGISRPIGRGHPAYKADQSFVKERPQVNRQGVYYSVQEGDSWRTIALRFNNTIDNLKHMNPEVNRLTPGTRLKVR